MRTEYITTVFVVGGTKQQVEAYLYGYSNLVSAEEFRDRQGRTQVLAKVEIRSSFEQHCRQWAEVQTNRFASGLLPFAIVTDEDEGHPADGVGARLYATVAL